MIAAASRSFLFTSSPRFDLVEPQSIKLGFANFPGTSVNCRRNFSPIKAEDDSRMSSLKSDIEVTSDDSNGSIRHGISTNARRSTNIVWHKCSVEKTDRHELLQQKGCVIWITGLSGSGKSTVACALTQALHSRGKLTYVLDGDNVRHGLNRDLTFKAEDRAENIRRIGEVAKLFADAGLICIASVISPYRKDRDACRSILPDGDFIEVFMDMPLRVCEARDPKGLYKLARAGKIKGFTGVDDPYEPPLHCEFLWPKKCTEKSRKENTEKDEESQATHTDRFCRKSSDLLVPNKLLSNLRIEKNCFGCKRKIIRLSKKVTMETIWS